MSFFHRLTSILRIRPVLPLTKIPLQPMPIRAFNSSAPVFATLNQVIRGCRKPVPVKPKAPALDKCPQRRGVCVKIFAVKPKKPNSAQRQVARVKLSSGKVFELISDYQ